MTEVAMGDDAAAADFSNDGRGSLGDDSTLTYRAMRRQTENQSPGETTG